MPLTLKRICVTCSSDSRGFCCQSEVLSRYRETNKHPTEHRTCYLSAEFSNQERFRNPKSVEIMSERKREKAENLESKTGKRLCATARDLIGCLHRIRGCRRPKTEDTGNGTLHRELVVPKVAK